MTAYHIIGWSNLLAVRATSLLSMLRRPQYMDVRQFRQYNMDMDFKTATDILALPATKLAEAFGLQPQTIRQMRLSPDAVNYRSPPDGWQRVLVRLARKRGRELKSLVEALERDVA